MDLCLEKQSAPTSVSKQEDSLTIPQPGGQLISGSWRKREIHEASRRALGKYGLRPSGADVLLSFLVVAGNCVR